MGLFDKKKFITYQEFHEDLEHEYNEGKFTVKEYEYLTGYFKPIAEKRGGFISEMDWRTAMKFLQSEWRDPVRNQSVQRLKRLVEKGPGLRKVGEGPSTFVEPKKD